MANSRKRVINISFSRLSAKLISGLGKIKIDIDLRIVIW